MRLEDIREGMRVRVSQSAPAHLSPGREGVVVAIWPTSRWIRVEFGRWSQADFRPEELEPAEVRSGGGGGM